MSNYSQNWQHLHSILSGYAPKDRRIESHSYSDHIHAKALVIFLTNATLATPKLDRETVKEVLAGKILWPHTSDTPLFKGVDLSLSVLEEHGLISFYANWCRVHCQPMKNLEEIDTSLAPLIQAVQHLKDISFGWNDYIQPHYTIPESNLITLLAAHFGSKPIAELIPELQLENGNFRLPPNNQSFSPLISTELWFAMRKTLEPKEAFERWILCFCINCDWAMPVLSDDSNYEFNEQLVAHLVQDTALKTSMGVLWKQVTNEESFSSILSPISHYIHMTIDLNGGSTHSDHEDTIKLKKPTLETLSEAYSTLNTNESSDLQMLQQWQQYSHFSKPTKFYSWLLNSCIEASIHIDGQLLASSGFTETLLKLTTSRPILKYLLFNLVQTYNSANYKILLLSQPTTCDIALFYLTQQSFFDSHDNNQSVAQHFEKGYQKLVCLEYLRTIKEESDSGDRLLGMVEILGGNVIYALEIFPQIMRINSCSACWIT